MRALLQRVQSAKVDVGGTTIGECGNGLMILVCAMKGDEEKEAEKLAQKIAKLRIFADENGKTNKSILDVGGSALVVSQFTLSAQTKGNRPGFSQAAGADVGKSLYLHFTQTLASEGIDVQTGEFGADMQVSLINDGPFTIWLDTETL